MMLRKITLVIILGTFACLALVLYFLSQTLLLNSFIDLENKYIRQNTERTLTALSEDIAQIDIKASDWAEWDDTYTFIKDRNGVYIRSNLVDSTFEGLQLNLMLFINSSGHLVYGTGFDLENNTRTPVFKSIFEHISTKSLLLQHPQTGVLILPEHPLLIVSRPILTSEGQGPSRGTLIMGRYLDSAEIQRLSDIIHLPLDVHRYNDPQMHPGCLAAKSFLSENNPIVVQPLSKSSIAGYVQVKDIYGNPALILKIEMPRDIYKQGQASISYFVWWLFGAGVLFALITLLLLDRRILSRLSRLGESITSIRMSKDLTTRVSIGGRDELSGLATDINKMLDALEHAQNERSRIEDALRQSEEQYRTLVTASPDSIFVTDLEGNIIYASPQAITTFGYESDKELIGKNTTALIKPEHRELVLGALGDALSGTIVENLEFEMIRQNGSIIAVALNAAVLKDHDGNPIGFLGSGRDITERKKTEKSLELYSDHLKIINRILRHDIINHLNVISSALRLYSESKQEDLLKEANCRVNKSVELIRRMKDLELLLSFDQTTKPIDVRDILERILIQHSSIKFSLEGECEVLADDALNSVLANIISNAILHGKTDKIDVKIEEKNGWGEIRIADYGIGIPDEIRPKVFDEGFRYGETGHSGLGLYIAKKVIEHYGGTIDIEDNIPKGVAFVLRLKRAA